MDEQLKKVYRPSEVWSDEHAKTVAKRDFEAAENYRTSNHDQRWQTAQLIYLAWVKRKTWEGTRIPRSSLPVFLAFEQIESMLPRIMGELFGDPTWFEAAPEPGTNPQEARATRYLMLHQASEMRLREQVRRAIKSGLIYGNGILELNWKRSKEQRFRHIESYSPRMRRVVHPFFGPIPIPTQELDRSIQRQSIIEDINRPEIRYVSLFDFYVDPNAPSPVIQEARFVCRRALKTVDELDGYRNVPGFKVPERAELLEMAKNRPSTEGDRTKALADTGRIGYWNPAVDSSTDPAAQRLEVVAYWTKDRLVWLLNREKVMFNDHNPEGFIPYYDFFYTDVLDRFYGLAVTDVIEGEQILQTGIINARIDELALAIHTPMAKKRGVSISPYQLRRRPDQVLELEDPSKDIQLLFPENVTQQSFIEITASNIRAQSTTGVTEVAMLGVPTSGGNSANRTATGIAQQAQASMSRIGYLVDQIETNVMEPMLSDWHVMNTRHLDPMQSQQILGPEGGELVSNLSVVNARVKFTMKASRRMKSRQALLQVFPYLFQTLMNPAFLAELARQQQKTINVDEIANILLDAVDYPSKAALFRNLSQQELQMMNQPPPEEMIRMQMQRERLVNASENTEMKVTGDLTKEIIKGAIATEEEESDREQAD